MGGCRQQPAAEGENITIIAPIQLVATNLQGSETDLHKISNPSPPSISIGASQPFSSVPMFGYFPVATTNRNNVLENMLAFQLGFDTDAAANSDNPSALSEDGVNYMGLMPRPPVPLYYISGFQTEKPISEEYE